jgi:hypothetical protein
MYTGDQDSVGGREFIGLDNEGNPIYGEAPKKEKETGKSFNDAIKDLFWDVLGREPRPEELSAYSRDFGAKIDPDEEQIFFDRSQKEIQGRNDPILNLYKEVTGGREPSFEEYRSTRKELGGDVSAEERVSFLEQYVDPSFKQQYEDLSASDPVYRLFLQELGRKPTLQEYRQFEGTFGATPTEQQRRAVRAVDPEVYGTRLIDQYRYMTGGQDPSEAQRRLVYQGGQENFTPQNLGEYLASQNLAGRDRYGANPFANYVAKNLPSNITPGVYKDNYQALTRPNIAPRTSQSNQTPWALGPLYTNRPSSISVGPSQYHVANLAGQYQTPSTPGVNYMGAPTNIAPITQGFQPVGMPSFLSGKGMPQQTRSFPSQTTNLGSPAYTQPTQTTLQISPQGIAGKGGRTSSALNTPMSAPDPTAFRAITGKG